MTQAPHSSGTVEPPAETGTHGSLLLDCFAALSAENPERPACLWENHSLSYGELDMLSSRLAGDILRVLGDTPRPVPIFLDRCCEVLIACLAMAKIGLPYVPVSPAWPEARTRKVLEKVDARIGIFSPAQPVAPGLTAELSVLYVDAQDRPSEKSEPKPNLSLQPGPDAPLYILFTSGSTGEPKGVVVTHRNVARFAASPGCPGYSAGKRITSCCATAFDLSVAETWGGMLNGCTMVCAPKETYLESQRCKDFLLGQGVDYGVFPTAVFNALASQDPSVFGSLEKVIICGELPNSALCKKVRDTAPPGVFYNTYGPTECTVFVTSEKVEDIDRDSTIPAGTPLSDTYLQIRGDDGTLLSPGNWGEVLIGGPGVAAGYFNDPERTAAAFIPDSLTPSATVYRTGDRGMIDHTGKLFVSGRFDDQIKISGMRIQTGEIKTLLNSAPGVEMAHIVHRPDFGLIAYVVLDEQRRKQGPEQKRKALRNFLAKLLPSQMIPSHFSFMEDLPLNANGKVDSGQLPSPRFRSQAARGQSGPSDILGAFRDALHDDAFTPEDSFLACGGNSLVAATLIGTLHRNTGVWVPLEFFSQPNTAQLVQMFISSASPAVSAQHGETGREQVRF